MLIVGARRAMPRLRRVPVLAAAGPVSAARSAFTSRVATPSPLRGETLAAAAGAAYGGDTLKSSRRADPSLGLLLRPDGCIAAPRRAVDGLPQALVVSRSSGVRRAQVALLEQRRPRALLAQARAAAAAHGIAELAIDADPQAEPFSLREGARRVGEPADP
jgi:hypothetical protein